MKNNIDNVEKNTIGNIAKLLNISSETIRKYQKKKIFNPSTVDENNYRYFNLATFNKLLRFLFYRKSQMNVTQAEKLLNCEHIELVPQIIDHQIFDIRNKIKWQNKLIERLSELNQIIDSISDYIGKLTWTVSPDFYYTPYYKEGNMLFDNKENINAMVDLMPLTTTCPLFRNTNTFLLEYGLIIEKKYADSLNLEYFEYYPSKPCLYTIVSISDASYLDQHRIQHIFDYATQNKLEIETILGRTIVSIHNLSGTPKRYHEFWVLLKS